MRALVVVLLAAACASAPGPKRPDESHRVPINRTVPPEVATAVAQNQGDAAAAKRRGREGEVEWR